MKKKTETTPEAIAEQTTPACEPAAENIASSPVASDGTATNPPKARKRKSTEAAPAEDDTAKITAKTRRENPDDVSGEDIKYIFEKRRTYMLSKKEAKREYKEMVPVTYSGDAGIAATEKRAEREEAKILMASARAPRPEILKGTVVGLSRTETQGIPMVEVELENGTGVNRIKIPVSQFLFYDEKEYVGEDGERHMNSLIEAFFGAKIPFVVYSYDEKAHIAYGSRLAALEFFAFYNFVRKDKRTGEPRMREGLAATASVLAVYSKRLIVDVGGVDVTLKVPDLLWVPVSDLRNEFRVGDTFAVKILGVGDPEKVVIGERTFHRIPLTVSRRDLLTRPETKYFDLFNVGDRVSATIKTGNTEVGIFVNLRDKMPCLCSTLPVPPIPESTCVVLITGKYEDKSQIRGSIIPGSIMPPRAKY